MQRIFLIGIKGAGMSALARILKAQGNVVLGSDITEYVFTENGLREDDIPVLPFQEANFTEPYDMIIRGNAFNKDNNIEVAFLEANGIATISYYDFLQQFLTSYVSFAIAGTHGKTTTTGLVAHVFEHDDVAYLIGDGTGASKQNAEYFIFEACEYKRHFLAYHPDYTVITNIEYDHPDYFADVADVIDAFSSLVAQTNKQVIAFGDDALLARIIASHGREKFITYGFAADNDFVITDVVADATGVQFTLLHEQERLFTFHLPFYGRHMLLNALPAIIIGHLNGKSWEQIEQQLRDAPGVKRRFHVEEVNGYTIIDDYAHHPTEIAVTLAATRQRFPDKKLVTIFQPHTFTRTEKLSDAFIDVLKEADVLYTTDIFASARETGTELKPQALLDAISDAHHLTRDNISELLQYSDSIFIFMGAGDIQKYLEAFKIEIAQK